MGPLTVNYTCVFIIIAFSLLLKAHTVAHTHTHQCITMIYYKILCISHCQ